MDTTAVVTRLRKLDGYLQSLRQLQAVTLDEYLDDDNLQATNILVHDYVEIDAEIVYRNLTEHLDDFELFAREIASRFLQ